MTPFSRLPALGLALLGLAACGPAPRQPPPPPPASAPARQLLTEAVERYWDERNPRDDVISPQAMADALSVERRFFDEVRTIPRDKLDADSKLSYDLFERWRGLAIQSYTFPAELMPMDPFGGPPQRFAAAAEDTALHPLATATEYEIWLRRIDNYVLWTEQAIANQREGVRRGYTAPRALIARMLPILQRLGEDSATNVFYTPVRSMPGSIKDPDRTRLIKAMNGAIAEKLLPATRALHDYLQRDYLPKARAGLALSDLPLGHAWYAFRVHRATGTSQSENDIYRLGLAEVDRLRPRLQALHDSAPHETVLPAPAPAAVTAGYQELSSRVSGALPTLFSALPKAEVEIRTVGALADPDELLAYRPAGAAGRQPAILYVATAAAAVRPTNPSVPAFLREALPGRHLQAALQSERSDLPRFRRFGSEPAFTAGWAMYAATLGEELGLYGDEAARYDAALDQMRCAVGLVVDTGLQAEGWTRAQAGDYLRAQLYVDDPTAQSMIDQYVASPAEALACKMGEMKLQSLRVRVQQALGARFDIREFHSQILKDGAMPLDMLETKINAWMEEPR